MKQRVLLKYHVLILSTLFVFSACQDDNLNESESVDEDMILATKLVDEYVSQAAPGDARARRNRNITVLKYEGGKLWFDTNTDRYKGYQEVTEVTTTAFVKPGEEVFWYSGGGLTELTAIEFDPSAQEDLGCSAEAVKEDRMWMVGIPEDRTINNDGYLKYDIIYQYKGNTGAPIRLDPKLKVEE